MLTSRSVDLAQAGFRRSQNAGPRRASFERHRPIAARRGTGLAWPVKLFLVSLFIPWIIPVGSLSMSAYRIVLVVTLVPCLVNWMRGKCGFRVADFGILSFCIWATASIFAAHGMEAGVQSSGILFVETLGAYLLARCYIRGAEDFRAMVALMAMLVTSLLPFSLYEWITGSKPLLNAFGYVFPTVEITELQPRWGFWRVQGPFPHAIVYGVFCGSIFALTHLVLREEGSPASRRLLTASVLLAAFLSMSSAPIAGLVLQWLLISWNSALRRYPNRWRVFWALIFAAYLAVEIGSNQTPVQFYISHFTFDQQTGWMRMLIWEFASASALNHPLLGIGFADWARPKWFAPDSIDNFWLAIAVRHGLPAVALILASCLWTMFAMVFKRRAESNFNNYRLAYIIPLATYMIVGTTVHFWAAPYVWFLFLLGSGAWLLDEDGVDEVEGVRANSVADELHRSPRPILSRRGRVTAIPLRRADHPRRM
jgi:hypothetical protein